MTKAVNDESRGNSVPNLYDLALELRGYSFDEGYFSEGSPQQQEARTGAERTLARFAELKDTVNPKLQAACEWLLPHFEEAVRDGGDHFEQRFCEEVVKRLRDALAPPA